MSDNNNPKKNGSGCSDPTAYAAIAKLSRNNEMKPRDRDKDVADIMHIIKRTLEIIDFDIEGHIILVDKRTGKKYY